MTDIAPKDVQEDQRSRIAENLTFRVELSTGKTTLKVAPFHIVKVPSFRPEYYVTLEILPPSGGIV